MKNIQKLYHRSHRYVYLSVAIQLAFASVILALPTAKVSADQLKFREIKISDSAVSTATTGVGSGTNVVYRVQFSFPATTAIAGVNIDFCTDSALPGDFCTPPNGFNVNRSTTTIANQSGLGTGAMAIKTASETLDNRIIINRASPQVVATGTPAVIEFGTGATGNGFTNPTALGSFYARIFTYTTQSASNGHNTGTASVAGANSGYLDYGGIALRTANVITITARVQENLIFCVSAAAPTSNCGGTTTPALTLGQGTNTKYIDSGQVYAATAYTQLSTNAGSGAIIRMRNSNACGGLSMDKGSTCGIPPINGGSNTPSAMTAGSAAFGLFVAAGSGGTGTVTPDSNYNGNGHVTVPSDVYYAMDSTSTDNTTTTYGDAIAASTAPTSNVNNTLTFAATAANTTPAGTYTANLAMIATGNF